MYKTWCETTTGFSLCSTVGTQSKRGQVIVKHSPPPPPIFFRSVHTLQRKDSNLIKLFGKCEGGKKERIIARFFRKSVLGVVFFWPKMITRKPMVSKCCHGNILENVFVEV